VYVDDIIVMKDGRREQQMLSQCLATKFEIEVDRHFIKEKLDNSLISPDVSIQNQLVDIFTRWLNCISFERIISKAGISHQLEGQCQNRSFYSLLQMCLSINTRIMYLKTIP